MRGINEQQWDLAVTHHLRSDKLLIPLIKARRVRALSQIPPLHSWKGGLGREIGWAQVQGTEAQAALAIAQSPPIAMDGGQRNGQELGAVAISAQ